MFSNKLMYALVRRCLDRQPHIYFPLSDNIETVREWKKREEQLFHDKSYWTFEIWEVRLAQ